MQFRVLASVSAVALALLITASHGIVHGQQALVLYDDFNGKFINPDKWFGQDFGSEIDRREQVREIKGNALRLASRLYGDPLTAGGRRDGGSRVRFPQPELVTAIQAELRATEVNVVGCSVQAPANARVTVQGFYFNDGSSTGSTDRTGEVSAGISIGRSSAPADPPGVLAATAFAFRCSNNQCSSRTSFFDASLGSVTLKEKTAVRLEWDQTNSQFIFQVGDNLPASVGYSFGTVAQAVVNSKIIDVSNSVRNCGSGVRSLAYMELFVDNVYVNAVP